MKCKRKVKKGDGKTYDRIVRGYLQEMLIKLGFHSNFVKWIMLCASLVKFYINVNGDVIRPITP